LDRCRLNIIKGSIEVDVDVGLDNTNLIVGLALNNVDHIVTAAMVDVD